MSLHFVELIRKKREGFELSKDELASLVTAYVDGEIPDYQMAAFLMAVYFRGMTLGETIEFTRRMLHSGTVVDLSDIPGVKVDKHSTGGVGDKVSIILAPLVAACGVPVPMISGRGLGHTGGTLDKLESIPGFRTDLGIREYKDAIAKVGTVMIGQTASIAPADKKMYALRDVTATVECIPLIAGSIMSKKLAEGIDALVLDIKTGTGAFMSDLPKAIELGRTLVGISEGFGKRTLAFVTDMNQPLGYAVGNWLEVEECIRCLRGENVGDLMELTYTLAGGMLYLGNAAPTIGEGEKIARAALENGKAFDKFLELVAWQGGDVGFIKNPESYPAAQIAADVMSVDNGYVSAIDCREIGLAAVLLGAGRTRLDGEIDPAAGIRLYKKIGDKVSKDELLAKVYAWKGVDTAKAVFRIRSAYSIGEVRNAEPGLIYGIIDKNGYRDYDRGS